MDDTSKGGGFHGDSKDINPANADDKMNKVRWSAQTLA